MNKGRNNSEIKTAREEGTQIQETASFYLTFETF